MLQFHGLPAPDQALALAEAPGRHQDQREREVGGRLGQHAGRVREPHAALRAGRDVDVVVADGDVRDHLQLRAGGVEEGPVDAVVQQRQDRVGAGRGLVQLRRRERPVVRRHPDVVGLLAQQLERRLGDPAHDHDPATHQTGTRSSSCRIFAERGRDVLGRVGVRDAHVALAELAERGARQHRHAGLLEQLVLEVARLQAGLRDVRERVERALRLDAADAGQVVQALRRRARGGRGTARSSRARRPSGRSAPRRPPAGTPAACTSGS